jgi:hypothetical protein
VAITRALRRRRNARSGIAAAAALWILLSALVAPLTAVAADPPTTTVAVTVVDEETHEPVTGAHVTLTGSVAASSEPVFEFAALANKDGSATFDDVPLSIDGHLVSVSADASLTETTSADGCTISRTWTGGSEPMPLGPSTAIEVAVSRDTAVACDPPGRDAPIVRGTVLEADGLPFPVDVGTISMHRPDGASWSSELTVGASGSFSSRIEPWGTTDEPADLLVRVIGVVTATETEGDCVYQLAPSAKFAVQVELAGGGSPDPIAIEAKVTRVSGVCGATGTPTPSHTPKPSRTPAPSPGSSGGATSPSPAQNMPSSSPVVAPTLPETDTEPLTVDAATAQVTPIALVLVLGTIVTATLARRTSRRRG